MYRLAKYILLLGIILGVIASVFVYSAALNHNPNEFYTKNPDELLRLTYLCLSSIAFPFGVISCVLLFMDSFKKANQRKTLGKE